MCMRVLDWKERGKATEKGWEARFIVSPEEGGKPTQENCEILWLGLLLQKEQKIITNPLFCLNQVRPDIL